MKTIRGGRGLGDAIYLASVVRHLLEKDSSIRLRVHNDWPDVFRQLMVKYYGRIELCAFTRAGIDILAHYSRRKDLTTKQFEDCCIEAGIKEPVDLRLDWPAPTSELVRRLRGSTECPVLGAPLFSIVLVQLPRAPMDRKDGFGADLLPKREALQACIDAIRDRALIVQIGAGKPVYKLDHIDVNLANETTVSELLDVASVADAFIGYTSFMVPLAESLNKPALFVWSRRGTKAMHAYIKQITPQKILFKPSSTFVFDDASPQELAGAANAFLG